MAQQIYTLKCLWTKLLPQLCDHCMSVWWVISPAGGPMTLPSLSMLYVSVICLSAQRWKENSYTKTVHSLFYTEKVVILSQQNKNIWIWLSVTACSHMCSLPSRTEEERREIKEREGNSSSSHSQHNRTRGGILLVKHWTGIYPFIFFTFILLVFCV